MIFATYWFLAFAILFFPIFWLCPKPALRLGLLLVVSAIFHTHYAGPAGVMPIVVMGSSFILLVCRKAEPPML